MLVTNGIVVHRYEEKPGPHRLGRHQELDSRSLKHLVEAARRPIKPAEWPSPIPILDQGNVGSCTAEAGTAHVAALYGLGYQTITLDGISLAANPQQFAVHLYHAETLIDGIPGVYPPDDTGSSGLAVCKVLKRAGLIAAYHWATSLLGAASMLQRGGCLIGMPWYNAFFHPDANGFIDASASWAQSGVAGGHELYVEALESWDELDPQKVVVRLRNSWGATWGDHGCGRMRGLTYQRLRQQIDVKQGQR